MNLVQLQKQIVNKTIDNIYVFTGEEIAVQKIYIDKIASVLNLDVQYILDYKSIVNKKSSLFGPKKLYVVIDDSDILKREDIWQDISKNNNIIFKYNNLDKRSKFYSFFEKSIVEFDKLSSEMLISYIKKDVSLRDCNCEKLIGLCDNNYNRILLELDKIKNYDIYDDIDIRFLELDRLGAFYKEINDITFEFVDAVITRNVNTIPKLKLELERQNEVGLGILTLLYNNFKTILLIQSCKSNDICKTTGLQNSQVYYNKEKVNYYTIGELVRALRIIQKLDLNIKTGKIEESIALDYLLVNII